MTQTIRPQLGDFMSIECFKYLRLGAEDTAGRALVIGAGRQRGLSLADVVKGVANDDVAITAALGKALGKEGTRLCIVDEVKKTESGYTVQVSESACSSGVHSDTPNCTFTLGVFIGAMETVTKRRLNGREVECVAVGNSHCIYELEIL